MLTHRLEITHKVDLGTTPAWLTKVLYLAPYYLNVLFVVFIFTMGTFWLFFFATSKIGGIVLVTIVFAMLYGLQHFFLPSLNPISPVSETSRHGSASEPSSLVRADLPQKDTLGKKTFNQLITHKWSKFILTCEFQNRTARDLMVKFQMVHGKMAYGGQYDLINEQIAYISPGKNDVVSFGKNTHSAYGVNVTARIYALPSDEDTSQEPELLHDHLMWVLPFMQNKDCEFMDESSGKLHVDVFPARRSRNVTLRQMLFTYRLSPPGTTATSAQILEEANIERNSANVEDSSKISKNCLVLYHRLVERQWAAYILTIEFNNDTPQDLLMEFELMHGKMQYGPQLYLTAKNQTAILSADQKGVVISFGKEDMSLYGIHVIAKLYFLVDNEKNTTQTSDDQNASSKKNQKKVLAHPELRWVIPYKKQRGCTFVDESSTELIVEPFPPRQARDLSLRQMVFAYRFKLPTAVNSSSATIKDLGDESAKELDFTDLLPQESQDGEEIQQIYAEPHQLLNKENISSASEPNLRDGEEGNEGDPLVGQMKKSFTKLLEKSSSLVKMK